jgi:3-isopropylmalate/(R)-2-methylmalate dehydratase large subunit
VVRKIEDGPDVFFIDRHFIHEVTSPVVFLGLKERGISVLYPSALLQLRITTHPQ